MIMPFLRLVTIYFIVIVGAVLFFKRDSVMPLLGFSSGSETAEVVVPEKMAEPVAKLAPAVTPVTTPTPQSQTTNAAQPSRYPTEQTAQITAPAPRPAAPTAASVDNIQTRLNEARQAYWNRDLTGAEALYKGLINDAPDNADIKGELGNLYYAQRRYSDAAKYYHAAGLQLIRDGNAQRVMGLIGVMQSFAPDKAADLRSRLSR